MHGLIKRIKEQNKPKSVFKIPINVYHSFEKTDLQYFIEKLEKILPSKAFKNLRQINVGKFQEFEDRNISAFSTDDQIFISNELSLEHSLRATVHEIAHLVENEYFDLIYGDGSLESEFIGKRKHLYNFLRADNKNPPSVRLFLNPRFSEKLDDFFYKEIGYDYLSTLNAKFGYGPTSYSLTSLSEYFADGFEYFFFEDVNILKNTCPSLYNVLYSTLDTLER